jgi:hypothetical protein
MIQKLRVSFILILILVAIIFSLSFFALRFDFLTIFAGTNDVSFKRKSEILSEFQPVSEMHDLLSSHKNLKMEELRRVEKEQKISEAIVSVEALFDAYNSPMAGLGETIVRRADECGGDYKLLVAIAGNESGFGRIPYKLYNPFGYLDGVQYSSWYEAVNYLSCKISVQHLAPCNNDVACVVVRYGGSDTDREKWIRNIQWFMNQL